MKKNEILVIDNLPPYGSLIVKKQSGGLGGEIYINESDLVFFEPTGRVIEETGKKAGTKNVYELPGDSTFRFDYENAINYLTDVKGEYIRSRLNDYKSFTRRSDRWKNVSIDGWNYRLQKIIENREDLSFPLYVKKSTNNRCFIGTNKANNIYSLLIAYIVIPNFSSLSIEKKSNDSGMEYVFRLYFNVESAMYATQVIEQGNENRVRANKTTEELIKEAIVRERINKEKRRAVLSKEKSNRTAPFTSPYDRDEVIAAAVKCRADGKCDLCGSNAPFTDQNKRPFLEEHHVVWLSNGGEDSINNAVALCPNCHRKMHVLNSDFDVEALNNRLKEYQRRFQEIIIRAE